MKLNSRKISMLLLIKMSFYSGGIGAFVVVVMLWTAHNCTFGRSSLQYGEIYLEPIEFKKFQINIVEYIDKSSISINLLLFLIFFLNPPILSPLFLVVGVTYPIALIPGT